MRRITTVKTALCTAGLVVGLSASASALTLSSAATTSKKTSSAGQPTPTQELLCGAWMTGTDRFSASNIDHPSGSTAMGKEYPYNGQNCDSPGSSNGTFTWTISHSNVNTTTERGAEHGQAMLTSDANKTAGFNGQITNFDFNSSPDGCGSREIFYTSGHEFLGDGSCSPGAPGTFNTQGGAATGDHFNGKYGTVVYRESGNSSCDTTSTSYCFQAIIVGQTN